MDPIGRNVYARPWAEAPDVATVRAGDWFLTLVERATGLYVAAWHAIMVALTFTPAAVTYCTDRVCCMAIYLPIYTHLYLYIHRCKDG